MGGSSLCEGDGVSGAADHGGGELRDDLDENVAGDPG
jgi:hypothetical protein